MNVSQIIERKIIITLTQYEALWLKAHFQNATHPDESIEDRQMREEIFTALNTQLNEEF